MSRRKRLAILAPLKRWGGIEGKLVTLCREWATMGVDCDLVRPRGGSIPYPERLPDNVRTTDLGTRSKADGIPALRRYLDSARPDAILTAKDHAAQVALISRAIYRLNVPVYVKVTNTLSDVARRRGKRWLIRWLYPKADAIIANSDSGAEDLARNFRVPRNRIRVIFNPTLTHDLHERARAHVGHPWLQESAPPVCLGAGRLTAQKDFETLLEGFARLRRCRDCHLVILGDGPHRTPLLEQAEALGVRHAVDLPGVVADALPWMRNASVFVVSSRYEGLVNVLIEAMAVGTPVVSTACGGVDEILDGGRHGAIVAVGDAHGLADAVGAALDDPGDAAQRIAATERFDSARVAQQYLREMGLADGAAAGARARDD